MRAKLNVQRGCTGRSMAPTQRIRQVQATDLAGVRSGVWNLRILEHRGGREGKREAIEGEEEGEGEGEGGTPVRPPWPWGFSVSICASDSVTSELRIADSGGWRLDRGSGLPCGIVDAREVRSWLAEWLGGWLVTPSVHDAGTKVTRGSGSGSKLTPGHDLLWLVAHANIEAKVVSPSSGWGAAPCDCSRPGQAGLCSDRASKRAKACQSGLSTEC